MSLLQEAYQFIGKMDPKKMYKMPNAVREELLWLCLCTPVMHGNARWPVSSRVGCSDASLQGGGRASCLTSTAIAQTLFRYSEHTGEHVHMDWSTGALIPPSQMREAPAEVESLMNAHCWTTSQMCKFSHRQHINILEMRMVKAELKELVKHGGDPQRCVLLVDSRVVVGAFGKGRSSSKQLNRLLRSMVGWSIAGQVSLHLVWVGTKSNPADHPSRGVPIPPPAKNDPVLTAQLGFMSEPERAALQVRRSNREINRRAKIARLDPSEKAICESKVPGAEAGTRKHPALKSWTFREIFAGKGELTRTFKRRNLLPVDEPLELIQRGKPCEEHDILNPKTYAQLCQDAKKPKQIWHFGMPCGSFSILQGLNQGTRSKDKPEGDGGLERERKGNLILLRTCHLCRLLHEHGSFFTIENPKSSYAWYMPRLVELLSECKGTKVNLDQCEYGLRIPDDNGKHLPARKSTSFAGTVPDLMSLHKTCCQKHKHVQVIGSVKTKGGWQRRSVLAGAYPQALCERYYRMCLKLLDT